jgi:hypothetical protein
MLVLQGGNGEQKLVAMGEKKQLSARPTTAGAGARPPLAPLASQNPTEELDHGREEAAMWSLRSEGSGAEVKVHALSGEMMWIGRWKERVDVWLDDGGQPSKASRLHARLTYSKTGGRWSVADNDSANGTFVNGRRVAAESTIELCDGDHLGFGSVAEVDARRSDAAAAAAATGGLPCFHFVIGRKRRGGEEPATCGGPSGCLSSGGGAAAEPTAAAEAAGAGAEDGSASAAFEAGEKATLLSLLGCMRSQLKSAQAAVKEAQTERDASRTALATCRHAMATELREAESEMCSLRGQLAEESSEGQRARAAAAAEADGRAKAKAEAKAAETQAAQARAAEALAVNAAAEARSLVAAAKAAQAQAEVAAASSAAEAEAARAEAARAVAARAAAEASEARLTASEKRAARIAVDAGGGEALVGLTTEALKTRLADTEVCTPGSVDESLASSFDLSRRLLEIGPPSASPLVDASSPADGNVATPTQARGEEGPPAPRPAEPVVVRSGGDRDRVAGEGQSGGKRVVLVRRPVASAPDEQRQLLAEIVEARSQLGAAEAAAAAASERWMLRRGRHGSRRRGRRRQRRGPRVQSRGCPTSARGAQLS